MQSITQIVAPPAAVLDCACGPGHLVLGLARMGYVTHGADISPAMIRIARRHARELASNAQFTVAAWHDLPRKVPRRFDVVLCTGNAIAHCHGEREMLHALRGMYAVLKPGGALYLDTRCWEDYRRRRVRFDTFNAKVINGERLIWLNVRHYPPRFTDPHLIEVVVITEQGGGTAVKSFPVTYYPFRAEDLTRRLRAAGFDETRTDFDADAPSYHVTCRAGIPEAVAQLPVAGRPGGRPLRQ